MRKIFPKKNWISNFLYLKKLQFALDYQSIIVLSLKLQNDKKGKPKKFRFKGVFNTFFFRFS